MSKARTASYIGLALVIVFFVGLLTLELFPPFEWSAPAADILKSSNDVERTINATLQQNRDAIEAVRAIINGGRSCPKRTGTSEIESLSTCVKAALTQAEMQNANLERTLISAREAISKDTKALEKSSDASEGRLFTAFDQGKRFLKWLGPTGFASLLIVITLGIIFSQKSIWSNFDGKASFNFANIKIDVSNISTYRTALADRFAALDREISDTYKQRVSAKNFDDLFSDVKRELDKGFKAHRNVDLAKVEHKATLYVPSLLQQELIQATGYLGHGFTSRASGVGRRFSVRYGIIGKGWRLRRSLYNPAVTNAKNGLIRHWGFTWGESAGVGDNYHSMIAFIIPSSKEDRDPLGVIFLESDAQQAFGAKIEGESNSDGLYPEDVEIGSLWRQISRTAAVAELIKALEALQAELHSDQKLITAIGR